MRVERFRISGPVVFQPKRHVDPRGYFSETFRQDIFEREVGAHFFVQDNHSFSAQKGTLRGLHFQSLPRAQGKLVRVTRGAVLDVIVDIRRSSPTYAEHLSVELSEENGAVLWVPAGFLHGFCTLTENTDFLYKVTDFYSPQHDGAVIWSDPDLAIRWPFSADELLVSEKDQRAGRLCDLPDMF